MSVNWDEMHKEGNRPWDLKGVTPILRKLFENEEIGIKLIESGKIKRILVPGCGQKNDCEYLGKMFPDGKVIGADISSTSIENCKKELDVTVKNVEFVKVDFFEIVESFDLIFDHTFFCAINPEMRTQWASKMGSIVNVYLLTIIYPLARDEENVDLKRGPPFEVTFSAYESILKDSFECVKRWGNSILPASNEKRRGREELALWRRI